MLDRLGCVVNFNKAAEAFFGYCKADILGHKMSDFIFPENSRDYYYQRLMDDKVKVDQGILNKCIEIECQHKNGKLIPIEIIINPILIADKTIFSVFVRDITERKKSKDKLYRAAFTDELTGVSNRRYFVDFLGKKLAVGMSDDQVGTLFFIDLDRFKMVNDNLGHLVGDELLRVTAQRLSSNLRDGDLVCRLGASFLCSLVQLRMIKKKPLKMHKRATIFAKACFGHPSPSKRQKSRGN